jgi:SOS response regulatory protein OraA/RecX
MSKTSLLEERLMKILVALKNCLKAPIIALLSIRGFSAERIESIITIHTDERRE